MAETGNKNLVLIIGIMLVVAVAGVILVLFLNKDYQNVLAEKSAALSSQQTEKPDVSAQENQKPAGKAESTIDACVDFDNGEDFYVSGITTIESIHESRQDYCADKITLTEFYCNKEGGISQETYYCSNGCADGACLKVSPQCTDSDDGANYYVAGKAYSSDGRSFGDVCSFLENSNGILVESVCEGGSARQIRLVCPSETPYCNKSVCGKIMPKCEDSDGGLNYLIKGIVNHGEGAEFYFDLCISGRILLEQYCENSHPKSKEYECPIGCNDGACVDTDLG